MGLLGTFLENFYAAKEPFQTIRARVISEEQPSASNASRSRPIGRRKAVSGTQDVTTEEMAFWAILPGHVRVETTRNKDGQAETTVEVVRGSNIFNRLPDGTVETETRSRRGGIRQHALPTDYQRHFDRNLIREFFGSLILEEVGDCTVAGRPCVRIRAIPLAGDSIWSHWLPKDADTYEFDADVDKPSLLSIRAFSAGKLFRKYEVTDLAYDEHIEPERFVCEPLEGQSTRTARPIVEHLSLDEAVQRVSFTILKPTNIRGSNIEPNEVMYHPARDDQGQGYISLWFGRHEDYRLWIHERDKAINQLKEELEWETMEYGGHVLRISDPQVEGGSKVLTFEEDGTAVEIISDLSLNELLDMTVSFVPVAS